MPHPFRSARSGHISEVCKNKRLTLRRPPPSSCYLSGVDVWESFEIIGPIRRIETIAIGEGIRDLAHLEERFGPGDWRKLKGSATVRLEDGTMHEAEIHWYEASGLGQHWVKIKRFLEPSR